MAAGFLNKLFELFGSSDDPEAAKKRRLKLIAKELSKNKYSKYYRVKTGEIEVPLGKLFFDIYRIISPAQVLMQNASKSAQLKQIVVETFFDKSLNEIKQRLTPESIEEKVKAGVKDLGKSLNSDFAVLNSALDSNRIGNIDRCYNNIMALVQFAAFDFYFVAKKFDSRITERNFTYQPKFSPVRGEYLKEELKDFLYLIYSVDPDQDWKNALAAMKTYKNGVDVIVWEHWNKLLLLLRDIKKSGMIDLMIRYIDQKPDWILKQRIIDEHIADTYLESKRGDIKAAVDKVLGARKNAQVDSLVKVIFGSAEINRVKFYTEKASEIYIKKNLEGFVYSGAINYLKAFLLDYFKKDLRELFDLLLIRGQWTDQVLSRQTSDYMNKLNEISDKLIAFDESISDTGENGSRLKASIVKADRDKNQARYVSLILNNVNEQAVELIKASAFAFIVIGKSMKLLSDDIAKATHELLLNWKELEGVSDGPLAPRISNAYKKIYYFVQLMQLYSNSAAGETGSDTSGSVQGER